MEQKLAINTVKYLYSINEYFKNDTQLENQLRQSLLQRAKVLEMRNNVSLPKKDTKPRVKCPRCSMPRHQSLAVYKLHKNKTSRFNKKTKKKVENGKVLTKYQEKYLKKKKYDHEQILEIHCKICKYKVTESVQKPEFITKRNCTQSAEMVEPQPMVTKREKKSKKNKQSKNKGNRNGAVSKKISKDTLNKKDLRAKNKNPRTKDLPRKVLSFNSNNKKFNKMNVLLSAPCKVKGAGLKDFIKSIT